MVIGCWESSLIESGEFWKPIVTPFELEVALTDDRERVWGGEWVGDFGALLGREREVQGVDGGVGDGADEQQAGGEGGGNWEDQESDDEPPDFDLRTGRYVSHSRPMGRPNPSSNSTAHLDNGNAAPASSALVQHAKGDLATVNGAVSPAAEFLRSQRTWQGLGSDYEIAYERDDEGKIRGAAMEVGRSGVARGYAVGEEEGRT